MNCNVIGSIVGLDCWHLADFPSSRSPRFRERISAMLFRTPRVSTTSSATLEARRSESKFRVPRPILTRPGARTSLVQPAAPWLGRLSTRNAGSTSPGKPTTGKHRSNKSCSWFPGPTAWNKRSTFASSACPPTDAVCPRPRSRSQMSPRDGSFRGANSRPKKTGYFPYPAATIFAWTASSVASGGAPIVMAPSNQIPVPLTDPSPPVARMMAPCFFCGL